MNESLKYALERVEHMGDTEAAGREINVLALDLIEAISGVNHEKIAEIEPVIRRVYEYLSAINDPKAESTPEFLHGRVAQLLELICFIRRIDKLRTK